VDDQEAIMITHATAVTDLMTRKVHTVEPGDDVGAVWRLMRDLAVRHVPVVDGEGDLVGLVTHRDLLRAALIEREEVPPILQEAVRERTLVREMMSRNIETVEPDTDLADAARLLLETKFGCLPVLEGRKLVGLLTESDFVRFAVERLALR
jgi:CBS domain-containing membrane protein